MNRRFWLSVVAYFVVTMAVAYPWHMLLFHEQYLAMGAFTREAPVMAFGMTAILLQAIVFSTLLPMFLEYKGGERPILRSVQFSLFLGLTVYSVMVFATAAKFQIEPKMDFILYGSVFQVLQFLLVGLALGLVHRR